jgi:hypothetical protein
MWARRVRRVGCFVNGDEHGVVAGNRAEHIGDVGCIDPATHEMGSSGRHPNNDQRTRDRNRVDELVDSVRQRGVCPTNVLEVPDAVSHPVALAGLHRPNRFKVT